MVTPSSKTERQVAGAGYIIGFFSDIEILTQNAAFYINNITKMRIKYKKIDEKTVFDPVDQTIIGIVENVKGSVFRTYIKFTALKQKIKEFENLDKAVKEGEPETIEKMYQKIRDTPLPDVAEIEAFVLRLNTLFVEAIDILATAQGIYSSLAPGVSGETPK